MVTKSKGNCLAYCAWAEERPVLGVGKGYFQLDIKPAQFLNLIVTYFFCHTKKSLIKFRQFKFIRLLSTWIRCFFFISFQAKMWANLYFLSFFSFLLLFPSFPPSIIHSLMFLVLYEKISPRWNKEKRFKFLLFCWEFILQNMPFCGECFPQTTSDFIRSCLILMYCNCFWQVVLHFSILFNKE